MSSFIFSTSIETIVRVVFKTSNVVFSLRRILCWMSVVKRRIAIERHFKCRLYRKAFEMSSLSWKALLLWYGSNSQIYKFNLPLCKEYAFFCPCEYWSTRKSVSLARIWYWKGFFCENMRKTHIGIFPHTKWRGLYYFFLIFAK